jgi:hypothetical protein
MTLAAAIPVAEAAGVRIGPVGWPDRTLFDVQAPWCRKWLRQPDGPDAGHPWEFTPEQSRFMAWWYAYDERGRWVIRRGTLRRMKGWGKDPLGAVICCIEGFGPCRIQIRNGRPFAVPNAGAWVQVAAVSQDQTKTTMRLFPGLIPIGTRERYRIEVHKEIVHIDAGRSVIEAITSSPLSAEGPRSSFVLRNETQNWDTSNQGHDMAETIDGNLAKGRDGAARVLSLCNAHVPGKDSVAEREWEAWQLIAQGRSRATGVLYDSLEAPADTDLSDETSLRHGLEVCRGDAIWLDPERLMGEIWDPRTTTSEARRKYLNQIVAAEDAWVAPVEWDALATPAPAPLRKGDVITLGFDGSKTDDHSGLVATRVDDGAWFTLGVWDPDQYKEAGADKGEIPGEVVDGVVDNAFGTFDVVGFYADVEGWESWIARWEEKYARGLCVKAGPRHAIGWDMRGNKKQFTIEGAEMVHDEIIQKTFRHDGDPRCAQHVKNARRRPNAWGVSFGKEHRESERKIDTLPAGCLSRMARRDYLALPKSRQRRRRSGRMVGV